MKALDKVLAIGVTACRKGNHSLRTRSGHCAQCNPASLAFQSRNKAEACVYVAGSISLKLIKVGMTKDVSNRFISLNGLGYGGVSDWTCLYWKKTEKAGEVEFRVHSKLNKYAAPTSYERFGNIVNCLETFSCDANLAINEVEGITSQENESWKINNIEPYQFISLTGKDFIRPHVERKSSRAIPLNKSKSNKNNDLLENKERPIKSKDIKIDQSRVNSIEVDKEKSNQNAQLQSSGIKWWKIIVILFLFIAFLKLIKFIN